MSQLERAVGGPLGEGWAMGAAMVWDESGRRDTAYRPILAAEALRQSLAARASASDVRWRTDCAVIPLPTGNAWHWCASDEAGEADLVVDATGSSHWLGRMRGIEVTIEELAGTDRCWSWTGMNDGSPHPWLLAARAPAQSAVLLRGPDGQIHLTLRKSGAATPDPLDVLDRLLIGTDAALAARIGSIALEPRPLRHDSPLARRTIVAADRPLPPLVRLGDGLIQTAPRLGQGIAQIAEQLAALAQAAGDGTPPARWQTVITPLAERRWTGLVLGTELGRIAA